MHTLIILARSPIVVLKRSSILLSTPIDSTINDSALQHCTTLVAMMMAIHMRHIFVTLREPFGELKILNRPIRILLCSSIPLHAAERHPRQAPTKEKTGGWGCSAS